MGHVYYFCEGLEVVADDSPTMAALRHAFVSTPAKRRAMAGPGQQGGVILAGDDQRIGYYPDRQKWTRLRGLNGASGVWLGWYLDAPPTPADLTKPARLPGHLVTLADGRQWELPVARRWSDDAFMRTVPARLTLDDNGQWVPGEVLAEYAGLWSVAEAWMSFKARASEQSGAAMSIAEAVELACTALAVNYRVSRSEVAALGLVDDQGQKAVEMLDAVIDWPTFARWVDEQKAAQKKTALDPSTPATCAFAPGPADSTHTTGPA